jgi:hypothetical protein
MRKLMPLMLLCLSITALAEKKPIIWENAKVIFQKISSRDSGIVAIPMGTMVTAVPIQKTYNVVVVETEMYRFEWQEKGNKFITLPVNGEIQFYRDKDLFIVLDSSRKKHKFVLTHMEVKN